MVIVDFIELDPVKQLKPKPLLDELDLDILLIN